MTDNDELVRALADLATALDRLRVSDRQWRDILGVLAGVALDADYLDTCARGVGLFELLERARHEA